MFTRRPNEMNMTIRHDCLATSKIFFQRLLWPERFIVWILITKAAPISICIGSKIAATFLSSISLKSRALIWHF